MIFRTKMALSSELSWLRKCIQQGEYCAFITVSQLTVSMSKLVNPSRHYSGLRSWSGELHDADPGQERGQEGDTNKYISCDRLANKDANEIS